ncbi:MAG: GAF domain-containing protein [Bacteroidia bacterium]|jgi:transcriptional regulator with GAF, ATPase, and Fis domain
MNKDLSHIQTINEVALQINSSLHISDVMNLIYRSIRKEMPISFFLISSYTESDDTIKVEFCVKKDDAVKEEFLTKSNNPNSLTAFTIRSRKEIIINDLSLDYHSYLSGEPQLHGKEDLWCESVLVFPLIVQNKIIGLFSVQNELKNSYTKDNIDFLRVLCPFIGIALNNAYLHTTLAEKSHVIENQNKDILDSIRYARRIQTSLLPTEKYIDKTLTKLQKRT